MPWGVDQIEEILLSVLGLVPDGNGVSLDGNSPFPLEVHRVKDLLSGFPGGDGTCIFQQSVRKSRFPVVDVRDYGEVPDMGLQMVSFEVTPQSIFVFGHIVKAGSGPYNGLPL